MFHSANSDTVEFTEIKEVASTDEAFIPVVHCNERYKSCPNNKHEKFVIKSP